MVKNQRSYLNQQSQIEVGSGWTGQHSSAMANHWRAPAGGNQTALKEMT